MMTPEEMDSIAALKHTMGGQALLKLATEKQAVWMRKLLHCSADDVAENARLRAKIFAYQRLEDFLNKETKDEGSREESQGGPEAQEVGRHAHQAQDRG
jgi:hypothetical protein